MTIFGKPGGDIGKKKPRSSPCPTPATNVLRSEIEEVITEWPRRLTPKNHFCKKQRKLGEGDSEECGQGEGGWLGEDKSENWNIFGCQKSTVLLHWGEEVGVPEMYLM